MQKFKEYTLMLFWCFQQAISTKCLHYPSLMLRCHHQDFNNDLQLFLPRSVTLIRDKVSDALGFNIRGGKEHYCGIYLSKVMPNTEAERLGLKEADQILGVNGISFEDIEHAGAVKILKSNQHIDMTLRFFPYGYKKTYEKVGRSPS
ncbi:PDZ domain-containing protein 11-like [Macrobrachium nipponense]|uniref:PDZ domain-containing protein 11-like n=1 Tax=Macrobrachium nipponense TaxID=159736 RepID=UPI0030C8A9CA